VKGRALALAAALCGLAVMTSACARRGAGGPELVMSCDFEAGTAEGWRPKDPAAWRVVDADGSKVYELAAPGEQGPVRAPTAWSLWTGREVSSFEFSGRLRCYTDPSTVFRDMCVFFHYQDPTHFGYVHFAGTSDGVHNIIGLVDGADRVKINAEPAGASVFRLTDREWHAFKVVCDAEAGEVRAYLDDMTRPILTAPLHGPGRGLVGVGSFDDTGAFDDLELRAPAARERRSFP
jgi:hypothetical protein